MKYGVTNHAIERYVERYKPHLGETQARQELYALLEFAKEVECPSWFIGIRRTATAWLNIAPGCVAVVEDHAVVTVITKELAERPARRKQREIERRRRQRERYAKATRLHSNNRGRPKSRIEEEAWPI